MNKFYHTCEEDISYKEKNQDTCYSCIHNCIMYTIHAKEVLGSTCHDINVRIFWVLGRGHDPKLNFLNLFSFDHRVVFAYLFLAFLFEVKSAVVSVRIPM